MTKYIIKLAAKQAQHELQNALGAYRKLEDDLSDGGATDEEIKLSHKMLLKHLENTNEWLQAIRQ